MPFDALARLLAAAGALLLLAAGIVWLLGRSGFHGLPGDLSLGGRHWRVHVPIVTSLAVSLLLTILLNVLARFWRPR